MIFQLGNTFEENFIVSNKIYTGFIELFQDRNPLHTDEKFAIAKGFKASVMHGNILNGFLSYFIGERLPLKNVIIHSQEIQFKNAVFLNNELHFRAEVMGIFESVNVIEFKYFFKNEELTTVAKGKFQIGILA
jgi:3-hydroxybutyryl-CoA dehydratase